MIFYTTKKKKCCSSLLHILLCSNEETFQFYYQHWFTHSCWFKKLDVWIKCFSCLQATVASKSYDPKNHMLHYRKSLEVVLLKIFPSSFSRLCASLRWQGRIGPVSFLSFIIVLAAKIEYLWLMETVHCKKFTLETRWYAQERSLCYIPSHFF